MNPPRLYGTVYLTPAGAARWPELNLEVGVAVLLIGPPGDYGCQRGQIFCWPFDLLLTDGDYTLSAPRTPAALEAPRPLAPPANPVQEVTACRTSPTPRTPTPTGSDTPAPLTPAAPGWPGMTGLTDSDVRGVGIGALGTFAGVVLFLLFIAWAVPW